MVNSRENNNLAARAVHHLPAPLYLLRIIVQVLFASALFLICYRIQLSGEKIHDPLHVLLRDKSPSHWQIVKCIKYQFHNRLYQLDFSTNNI